MLKLVIMMDFDSVVQGSSPCTPAIYFKKVIDKRKSMCYIVFNTGDYMSYLLERLQKLDKQIEEAERALLHLTKQAGSKVNKINNLKTERATISAEYKESNE
jgi:hypothetical protein